MTARYVYVYPGIRANYTWTIPYSCLGHVSCRWDVLQSTWTLPWGQLCYPGVAPSCLNALSNTFLSFRSLRGLPGVQNILIFTCLEQCFPIFLVTPRTARSTEYIDFYVLWRMYSYLWGHSEDCQECRIYWFVHALTFSLSFRSLRGLPGVQTILILQLIFTCLEQCFHIF